MYKTLVEILFGAALYLIVNFLSFFLFKYLILNGIVRAITPLRVKIHNCSQPQPAQRVPPPPYRPGYTADGVYGKRRLTNRFFSRETSFGRFFETPPDT